MEPHLEKSMLSVCRCSEDTVPVLDFQQFETETDYDALLIFNGANNQAPNIGYLTGSMVELETTHIEGNTNQITLEFQSDDSEGAGGPPSAAAIATLYCTLSAFTIVIIMAWSGFEVQYHCTASGGH
jgi:hypothetical protein